MIDLNSRITCQLMTYSNNLKSANLAQGVFYDFKFEHALPEELNKEFCEQIYTAHLCLLMLKI